MAERHPEGDQSWSNGHGDGRFHEDDEGTRRAEEGHPEERERERERDRDHDRERDEREGRYYSAARTRGEQGREQRTWRERIRAQAPDFARSWDDRAGSRWGEATRDREWEHQRLYREPGSPEPRGRSGHSEEESRELERRARAGSRDLGFEGWGVDFTEGEPGSFERGRAGFHDFGTPTYSQGRELRERYDERDFPGRDDRYAGRSGGGFHPEDLHESPYPRIRGGEPLRREASYRTWRTPEEEWERAHDRGQLEERRGRIWEHEPTAARDVMTPNPRSVRRTDTLRTVGMIMRDENTGVVPVVDESNRIIGLITDRDMVMRTANEDRPWQQWRAEDVMSDDIECVTSDESLHDVIRIMGRKQVRRIPVVDRSDRLLGMISMADIANRADRDEELQHALDRISRRRSFWSRLWR